jgi:protein involved in polysaccharide export with SLBB domain
MKHFVTFFAVAVLAGCASHKPQQQVTVPSEIFPAPSLVHTTTIVETNLVVFVSGAVVHPGHFVWTKGLGLTNAIYLAGGFTDFAQKSELVVLHGDGSRKRYNFEQLVMNSTNNPPLEPYDVVAVPRRVF